MEKAALVDEIDVRDLPMDLFDVDGSHESVRTLTVGHGLGKVGRACCGPCSCCAHIND